MTNEEAISILTKDRALCLFNPWTGEDVPLNEDCRMSAEAMNLAIKALEKQIPKKPYWEHGVWHCKSCGLDVFRDDFFCPICGQEIDWEDDE